MMQSNQNEVLLTWYKIFWVKAEFYISSTKGTNLYAPKARDNMPVGDILEAWISLGTAIEEYGMDAYYSIRLSAVNG